MLTFPLGPSQSQRDQRQPIAGSDAVSLRASLEAEGAIFQSSSDSEVVVHLIAHAKGADFYERVAHAVSQINGSFSMVIMRDKELIAVRDPYGVRPFSLGIKDGAYVVASETCSFDLIGATYIRDIEPGEILIINENGLESLKIFNNQRES